MLIRRLEEKDYDNLKELVCLVSSLHNEKRPDIYTKYNVIDRDFFNQLLSGEKYTCLVACEFDKVIGQVIFFYKHNSNNPLIKLRKVLYIDDICVSKEYQNKGVATSLYNEVLKYANKEKCESVELMAWSFNTSAIKFYEKIGFKVRSLIMENKLDKSINLLSNKLEINCTESVKYKEKK